MRKKFTIAAAALALTTSCALASSASAGDGDFGGSGCGHHGGGDSCLTSLKGKSFSEQATYTYRSHGHTVTAADSGVKFLNLTNQPGDTLDGFKFTLNDTGQSTGSQQLFEIYDTATDFTSLDDQISVAFDFTDQSNKSEVFTATGTLEGTGKNTAELVWDQGGVFTFDNLKIQLTGGPLDTSYTTYSYKHDQRIGTAHPAEIVSANFTLAPCGAVPEPESWAMMLLGFFGLGALQRRRRSAGAITA